MIEMRFFVTMRSVQTIIFNRLLRLANKGAFQGSFKIVWPYNIRAGGPTTVGERFFAGEGLYISTNRHCTLTIGNSVMFGPRVMILGGNHNYQFTDNHMAFNAQDDPETKDITIETGAWIGASTTILSGARIGEGAIVGAGSIVSRDIPPYMIAAGAPARPIKPRFDEDSELATLLDRVKSTYSAQDLRTVYESLPRRP